MDFDEFTKAKAKANEAIRVLEQMGLITHAHSIKKYCSLLETWNDKMVEALELVEASQDEKEPIKLDD